MRTLKKLKGEYKNMYISKIETSINALNETLLGGVPTGTLIGFYGKPQCGKTTTAVWTLLDVMKKSNKNGIIIDTETGLAKQVLPDLLNRYNNINNTKIGLKNIKLDYRKWTNNKSANVPYKTLYDDKQSQQVVVLNIANVKEMLLLVGKPHRIDLDSTKPTVQLSNSGFWENIWQVPLAQLLDDPNSETEYCGFVIDSFTKLFKIFGVNPQTFPARDTTQSIILDQLSELLEYYEDMIGINNLHASQSPMSNDRSIPHGGKSIGHSHKFMVEFKNPKTDGTTTIVTLLPYRLPTNLGSLIGYELAITDNGVM